MSFGFGRAVGGGTSGYTSPTRENAAYLLNRSIPTAGVFKNAEDLSLQQGVATVATGGVMINQMLGENNTVKTVIADSDGEYLTYDSLTGGYQFAAGTAGTVDGPIVTTGVAANLPAAVNLATVSGAGSGPYNAGPVISTNNAAGTASTLSIQEGTLDQVLTCTATATGGSAATYAFSTPVSVGVNVMTTQAEATLTNEYNMGFALNTTGASGGASQKGICGCASTTGGTVATFQNIVPTASNQVLTCSAYTSATNNTIQFQADPIVSAPILTTAATGALSNEVALGPAMGAAAGILRANSDGTTASGFAALFPSAQYQIIQCSAYTSATVNTVGYTGPFFIWGTFTVTVSGGTNTITVTGTGASSIAFVSLSVNANAVNVESVECTGNTVTVTTSAATAINDTINYLVIIAPGTTTL